MDRPNFSTSGSVNGSQSAKSLSPSSTAPSSSIDANSHSDSSTASQRQNHTPAQTKPPQQRHHRAHSHSVSIPSVIGSVANSRSRHAEPGTFDIHIHPARSSQPASPLPAATSIPLRSTRALLSRSSRLSAASEPSSGENSFKESLLATLYDGSKADTLTPASAVAVDEQALNSPPEAVPSQSNRSSWSETYNRRLSTTSIYSLVSARGIQSSSPHGFDKGHSTLPRSVSTTFMTSNKSPVSGQSEAGVSNVNVTTSTTSQPTSSNPGSAGQHQLTTRDPHSQPLDLMRRNQRSDNTNTRVQPDRSRSRVKRRFSGSTANSSHSPSSDRGPAGQREKEECK